MKSKIFGFVMRRKHGNVYKIIVFSFNNSLKLYIIIICLFLQLDAQLLPNGWRYLLCFCTFMLSLLFSPVVTWFVVSHIQGGAKTEN